MISGDSKMIMITATKEDGEFYDVTGAVIKWALKRKVNALINDITKTTDDGIILSNPTNGEFTIKLEPLDTIRLTGSFYHECEITDVHGNISTVTTGIVSITPSIV